MCDFLRKFLNKILSTEILKITIPVIIVITGWYFTEQSKIRWEQYQSKKESYQELIKNISGFSRYQLNANKRQKFIDQINICWLYAPDEVIKKGYDFIRTVGDGSEKITNSEREQALSEFILTIRQDMLSRKIVKYTELDSDDFQYLRPLGN